MKLILILLTCLFTQSLRAEGDDLYTTVPCGKDTVVEFRDTRSPDGRFALGWTIQPSAQDAQPVDWTELNEDGDSATFSNFIEDIMTGQDPTHRIFYGVIDFRSKSFKPLPIVGTTPLDPIRSTIYTKWVDKQHAIILRNGKWSTDDALFVRPASQPLEVTDILPRMNDQVGKLIREKRPLAPDVWNQLTHTGKLLTRYGFAEVRGVFGIPCKVEDGVLHASFSAQIPRDTLGEDIGGHILISLKDGTPLKAVSDDPNDQPFVGELGAVDKQLNQVYSKLRNLLTADARKQLMADQVKWISTRNEQARELAKEATSYEAISVEAYREVRNQQALKLTRARTEVLLKQFESIAPKSRVTTPRQN
jgi:uncharacterized protein YecT (DUF1311 family)